MNIADQAKPFMHMRHSESGDPRISDNRYRYVACDATEAGAFPVYTRPATPSTLPNVNRAWKLVREEAKALAPGRCIDGLLSAVLEHSMAAVSEAVHACIDHHPQGASAEWNRVRAEANKLAQGVSIAELLAAVHAYAEAAALEEARPPMPLTGGRDSADHAVGVGDGSGKASTPPASISVAPEIGWVLINGHRYVRPVLKVAHVTVDGTSCVVPASELVDLISGGADYTVRIETMSVAKFKRLPEFGGW